MLFNPPFFRGEPKNLADRAWHSPDIAERFASQLGDHLAVGGFGVVVLSTDGDIAAALWSARHLTVRAIRERDLINEKLTVYEIRVAV